MSTKRDEDDLRFKRFGYIYRGEKADELLKVILKKLPGDGVLPLYWKYVSEESFLRRFSDRGVLLWAKAASSHLLMVGATYACRIWVDAKHCLLIDTNQAVATLCAEHGLRTTTVPSSAMRKSAPFIDRVSVYTEEEAMTFLSQLIYIYGLQDWEK